MSWARATNISIEIVKYYYSMGEIMYTYSYNIIMHNFIYIYIIMYLTRR